MGERAKEIAIFSGSFNPIHAGHLMLASYICEFTHLDEVWLLVSPRNPLKEVDELLGDQQRLAMVTSALEPYRKLKASDVEFYLPRPSYTIDTLDHLSALHPGKQFTLIIGADNWNQLPQWKEYGRLLQSYPLLIYPRQGEVVEIPEALQETVRLVDAPLLEISSTFIRKSIREGRDMRAFVPDRAYELIMQNGWYR
ncbi:MAG TPA: nicotinic acid mononucleotide adenylyltransferase [Porphyromonadaceae bacterium]|nr:nicotinic acid mononucleotide adenylyltransferase [Porphyromonadaceae bacterium]